LLGDLQVGERGADGDVAVSTVVVAPLAGVGVDGANADDVAAGDVDDGLDVGAAAGGDRPPLAVGVALYLLAGAGLAETPVAPVEFGCVAVDDEGAVAAFVVGGEVPVEGRFQDSSNAGVGPYRWPSSRDADALRRLRAGPQRRLRGRAVAHL